MTTTELVTTCPVCESPGTPLDSQWPHSRCGECGHVWVDGSSPSADNEYFESDDYANWRTESDYLRQRQIEMADERLGWLGDLVDEPGSVLELGCSTGEAAAAMAARGWTARGVDPSAPAIKIASERYDGPEFGLGITPDEAGFPSENYDLVMAFHVLEHVPNLDEFAELTASVLKPGGHLYLRLPNWESWSRRVFGDRWPDNMAEHLHHFSESSMRTYLDRAGFDTVKISSQGQSRSWIGGLRRVVSSDWNAEETMPTTGDRSQSILKAANSIGRPFFAIEERYGAGSELLVLGRRRGRRDDD